MAKSADRENNMSAKMTRSTVCYIEPTCKKNRIVDLMEWPVANTKTKREKNDQKKIKWPQKCPSSFFVCPKEPLYQKLGFQGRKCGHGDII